jgi:C-5 cytosine-specific DNA methylase
MSKPLAVDMFAGLGGWTDGLLAAGFEVVGFDIERHVYGPNGEHRYPAQLVLQDVRTLHGRQFRDASLIVASPPCQEFSYMAMPFSRGKQIARALRGTDVFPDGYTGSRTLGELTALFDACFRLQREASAAAGWFIPLVVENVCGAQPWVGPAKWRHGSFYLWGDVPALMPTTLSGVRTHTERGVKNGGRLFPNDCADAARGIGRFAGRATKNDGTKVGGDWFHDSQPGAPRSAAFGSLARKFASAHIAKIPFALSSHIAETYYPASLRTETTNAAG